MREEMVTKHKLDAAFPAWAVATPREPRLSRGALTRLAQDLPDPVARDIATDVLALAKLRIKDEFRPDLDGEYLVYGAVLSWREDDLTYASTMTYCNWSTIPSSATAWWNWKSRSTCRRPCAHGSATCVCGLRRSG